MEIDINEAAERLESLVADVMKGKEVILTKAGLPIASMVPFSAEATPRKLGIMQGKGYKLGAGINDGDEEIEIMFNRGE
uniref:type II toxin-antitoxin system Phd/YefM family antitoxin n=1 Tax=Shewanella gaetbuli TaxID=220752 RepID=UPI003B59F627